MRSSLVVALAMIGGGVCAITTRAAADEPLPVYPVAADDARELVADDDVSRARFDDHPFAIELRTGAGAATGLAGFVLEYNVHDRLVLNAGLGTNLLGISSSVGARARPIVGASSNRKQLHALILETSLSRSASTGEPAGDIFFCDDRCIQPQHVSWVQAEAGWEARFGHLQIQTSLGAAFLLGNPNFSCAVSQYSGCSSSVARILFTQTFGIGYAF
jgi:hypothetical protein